MTLEDRDMTSTATTGAAPDAAPPEPTSADDRPPGRMRRLRNANLDLRNTWQIVAGSLLLPLGIAFILLAWSGAAHGRVDQQQIPYVVSGGLGGLAVVMIGCFFYWAHWLYRIYDQADLHHQETLREQREMMRELIEALAAGGAQLPAAAPAPETTGVGANGIRASRVFVATASGSNFHTAGCPMVANRAGGLRTVTEDEAEHMKPCRVCEPLVSSN